MKGFPVSRTKRLTQPSTADAAIRTGEPVLRNRRSTVLSRRPAVRSRLFQCCLFDGAEATEASPSLSRSRLFGDGFLIRGRRSRARVSGVGRPLESVGRGGGWGGQSVHSLTTRASKPRCGAERDGREAGGMQRMCARGRVTLRPAINNLHGTAMMPKHSEDATLITSHARGNFGWLGSNP